jgi:hypothetical protein
MKKLIQLSLLLILAFGTKSYAQQGLTLDSAETQALLKKCAVKYPKFYREFNYIKAHDTLIKKFLFVRSNLDNGPAKAGRQGNIFIDVSYLENERPNFDDNRLIVVLYHEIGHLHYYLKVPAGMGDPLDSEQAAFEYSLLKTKEIAEKGDCQPLKAGVKFMKLRSEGTNLQDPHVRALKKIIPSDLYAGYVQYVNIKCPD